jgi:hypothetical protein
VKISPLVTLGVVAVLGVGILLVNVSQGSESAKPADPWAKSTTTAATLPGQASTAAPTAAEQFPAKADYVGKITTASPMITLEITIQGDKAIAYACDGNTIEAWLRGSAQNGVLNLESKDKKSRLDGRLQGTTVAGTLSINQKKWDFTAPQVQPPAGLYVYNRGDERTSWIIDQDGAVTGVQRRADGSTAPAPGLSTDGTAVIDGQKVVASRVEGDSDV